MNLIAYPSFFVLRVTSFFFFFFKDPATTEIYTLSLHDALPILWPISWRPGALRDNLSRLLVQRARLRNRLNRSEEHTSELQSHSDLVCRLLLEKKNQQSSPARHGQGHADGHHADSTSGARGEHG